VHFSAASNFRTLRAESWLSSVILSDSESTMEQYYLLAPVTCNMHYNNSALAAHKDRPTY